MNPHQYSPYDELQPVNAQKIGIFIKVTNEKGISSKLVSLSIVSSVALISEIVDISMLSSPACATVSYVISPSGSKPISSGLSTTKETTKMISAANSTAKKKYALRHPRVLISTENTTGKPIMDALKTDDHAAYSPLLFTNHLFGTTFPTRIKLSAPKNLTPQVNSNKVYQFYMRPNPTTHRIYGIPTREIILRAPYLSRI